ncbi:MAG: efflux RND transporter periplasmic adaptor subunit [Candidatus Omnitrophota bacterium]|nr:efflux RND transporter periplasmic adaptor subunit [Candidatus Omnitrophota bacterium]MDZ4241944.1 efflux RND transporter periplasmic adaptor subunit [Candidatus Omnitrophota bacterium]
MFRNSLLIGLAALALAGCGEADKGGHGGGFAVSVIAEPVKQEKIEDKISLVGTLAADEAVEIKNQVPGVIEQIGFEEGQAVQQGQMLFMIDAAKLNASLSQAEANLGLAGTTFERLSSLIKSGAVSQQEYDQAKSDLEAKQAEANLIKAQLKETVITASFDGVMGERKVSLGQFVNQGSTLTYLISQDPMKAEFRVPERFLGQLKDGQKIQVSVAAYPEDRFSGAVYFIDPQVEETTRTALVKARVPNPEGQLRRGMFANLDLIVSIRPRALVVPESALIPRGEEVFTFIVDAEGKAQMKPVKVGVRLAGKAEILEGLSAGENVIVEGHQKVGPGSPVKIKEEAPGQGEPAPAS